MPSREELEALRSQSVASINELTEGAFTNLDALEDSEAIRVQQQAQIATLQQQLADCQDNEPDPDPSPVPGGEFWWGDDMTLSSADAIRRTPKGGFGNPDVVGWGQYSGPGSVSSRVELRDSADGPLVDGAKKKYRRITCNNGDRTTDSGDSDAERVEIGQVNNDYGCVFPVGSEMVVYARHRVPTNLPWGTGGAGGGENGSLCQMKHSSNLHGAAGGSAGAYGGYGGNPDSSGPPLHLKQDKDGIFFDVKPFGSGDVVWRQEVPNLGWWDLVYHIHYAVNGHVDLYYCLNGETPKLVYSKDHQTVKYNTNGKPMYCTYRNGIYQSTPAPARFLDVGPVTVERIG